MGPFTLTSIVIAAILGWCAGFTLWLIPACVVAVILGYLGGRLDDDLY